MLRLFNKKLDQKGFAHHLLIPILAILVLAGTGAYFINRSKAAVSGAISSEVDCNLLGRKWTVKGSGKAQTVTCEKKCILNNNELVTTSTYDYCKKNISFITRSSCDDAHRRWSSHVGGCTRRADQETTKNAIQCKAGYNRYVVASAGDFCDKKG